MAHSHRRHAVHEATTEIVISILPIIVVLLVMFYVGKPMKLFQKPEWAFGAAIFFGQSLVKLVTAMTGDHRMMQVGKVVLFSACVLVFGLVPSLLVLVFVIHSIEQVGEAQVLMQVLQVLLFVLGAFTYVVVGAVCHEVSIK